MIRVLIVDDEPLARRGIAVRLERAPDIRIVGECASGREAIESIRALEPDLVYLDVAMPRIGGFDVVRAIGADRMPTTVFVTAFDRYALDAFEAQALDYLLKPIDDERFARALDRARTRIAERRRRTDPADDRIVVRERGRAELIESAGIVWVEARGDYVRLHLPDRAVLLRNTLSGLAERLDPARFVRIHRSILVNRSRVLQVDFHAGRECFVTLEGGTRLPVGRRYRDAVERMAR
jgi:two-component system, LytTR family, response regulator